MVTHVCLVDAAEVYVGERADEEDDGGDAGAEGPLAGRVLRLAWEARLGVRVRHVGSHTRLAQKRTKR